MFKVQSINSTFTSIRRAANLRDSILGSSSARNSAIICGWILHSTPRFEWSIKLRMWRIFSCFFLSPFIKSPIWLSESIRELIYSGDYNIIIIMKKRSSWNAQWKTLTFSTLLFSKHFCKYAGFLLKIESKRFQHFS